MIASLVDEISEWKLNHTQSVVIAKSESELDMFVCLRCDHHYRQPKRKIDDLSFFNDFFLSLFKVNCTHTVKWFVGFCLYFFLSFFHWNFFFIAVSWDMDRNWLFFSPLFISIEMMQWKRKRFRYISWIGHGFGEQKEKHFKEI